MVTLPNGNPQAPEDHQQRIEVWDQILQKFVFDANFLTESMFPITTMGINTETCTFVFGSFRSSANNGLALWYPAFSQVYILPSETPVTDLSISRTADIVATIDNYSQVNLFYLGDRNSGIFETTSIQTPADPFSLAFSADGNFLAVAASKKVTFYEMEQR
jgi:hypothetical protein